MPVDALELQYITVYYKIAFLILHAGICFTFNGICLFYSHSDSTLLSEFNNLERERNRLKLKKIDDEARQQRID